MQKITPFLWFDSQAEEAANFYVSVFKDAKINSISRYPTEAASMEPGKVMIVELTLQGVEFTLMNAGPHFQFSEAISFTIHTQGQEETDHYWNTLTADGGQESQCGWLKDKFGLSWQVTPKELIAATTSADRKKAGAAMQAMMKMKKIIIKDIEDAYNNA